MQKVTRQWFKEKDDLKWNRTCNGLLTRLAPHYHVIPAHTFVTVALSIVCCGVVSREVLSGTEIEGGGGNGVTIPYAAPSLSEWFCMEMGSCVSRYDV